MKKLVLSSGIISIVAILFIIPFAYADEHDDDTSIILEINKNEFLKGETIIIKGIIKNYDFYSAYNGIYHVSSVMGSIVSADIFEINRDGSFEISIVANNNGNLELSGPYKMSISYGPDSNQIIFKYLSGIQPAVVISSDSHVQGCEETNSCYTPNVATVKIGQVAIFVNADIRGHTFTSGTTNTGPDGIFDSGYIKNFNYFEYTPDTIGEFPYMCMIHSWMQGMIIVEKEFTVAVEDIGDSNTGYFEKVLLMTVDGAKQTVEFKIIASDGEIIETLSSIEPSDNGDINLAWIVPKNTEPEIYTIFASDTFNSDCVRFDLDTFVTDNNCDSKIY